MDAETRHQLKQNELAQAISGIADFSDKRTWAWLGVILVVIVVYGGYKYVGWRARAVRLEHAQSLSSINIYDSAQSESALNQLRELLGRTNEPELKALTRFKLAQGLELHAGAEDADKLAAAEAEYQQVLDARGVMSSLKASALYRLALLKENRRDFAGARACLAELSENPNYAGSPLADLAKSRLESLDDLSVPVAMLEGGKPAPAGTTVSDDLSEQLKSVLVNPAPPAPPAEQPKPETEPAPPTTDPDTPERASGDTPADIPSDEPTEPPAEPEEP